MNWLKRLWRLLRGVSRKEMVELQFEHAKAQSRLDMAIERFDKVILGPPKEKPKNGPA